MWKQKAIGFYGAGVGQIWKVMTAMRLIQQRILLSWRKTHKRPLMIIQQRHFVPTAVLLGARWILPRARYLPLLPQQRQVPWRIWPTALPVPSGRGKAQDLMCSHLTLRDCMKLPIWTSQFVRLPVIIRWITRSNIWMKTAHGRFMSLSIPVRRCKATPKS